ncbi:hypothetical protein L0663_25790 [Dyadobacter sp. CY107]|uniref:hypothetical protein n=1 Tax=Dyadobacter fanqingshengii TaxID=2906443 RepID=UPI001F3D24A8|nr:hypothetical protein [Dyadobacter fanqingshengii]MCF2506829.1 hypothetical protein [Dyadobacter fanqingshengii]
MNETMMLPVEHRGTAYEFPLTIVTLGYTYQLHVQIEGKTLIFEMDDQHQYRVLSQAGDVKEVNKSLVEAIVSTLQSL